MAPVLSLCMIVRDEAELLPRCLESVRGVVDEIVVVDTGSRDATPAIARAHGATVASFAWCDDFGAARNASLERATGDWILVMDADEVLTPGSGALLRAALLGEHGAYTLELENATDGDEGQTLRLLRLFRNHPAIRFEGRVHEQVTSSLERLGLTTGACAARLWHDGYLKERMALRSKHARNLSLLEAMRAEEPRNPYVAYHLGKTLMAVERHEEAEQAFAAALELLAAEPRPERVPYYPTLYLLQAALVERRDGPEAAHALVQEGLRRLPEAAKLWLEAGRLLRALGRLDAALDAFARSFELAEVDPAPELARVPERAATGAAEVLMALGRQAEALECLIQATEVAPPAAYEPWLRLAVALLQAGRLAEARAAYEAVVARNPAESSAQLALATLYFETAEYPRALSALQAVEAASPGRPDVAFLMEQCRLLS
ncbi:MAG TPA: glycosyltransferase [Stenomitos sp.]